MVKEEIFSFLSSPEEDNGVPSFSIEEMTINETVMANDYLHPNDFLNPNTPGRSPHSDASSHLGTPSVYSATSDASSLVNSPYYDAMSQHSANPPAGSYIEDQNNHLSLQYNRSGQQAPPTFDISTFDQEISLGQSVSSTNLPGLQYDTSGSGFDPNTFLSQQATPQSFHSANSPNSPNMGQSNAGGVGLQQPSYQEPQMPTAPTIEQSPMSFNQLTENNLSAYNNQQQVSTDEGLLSTRYNSQSFPVINIQQAPELTAAKTPSLFSNSSANSSVNSLKPKSESNFNLVPNSHLVTSPGSVISDSGHLQPDDSQRRGRKLSQNSRSRGPSRSPVRDALSPARSDISSHSEVSNNGGSINGTTNREKILELASPNVSSKRTQKHPSVYACHLCEKRFTRPYNLKSHLRTHTDERPFICNVCGKAFARQHDRKRHEELHTGEKKFQCKGVLKDGTPYGCGRKFARADALRRHFQTEAGKECIRMLIEEEEFEKGVGAADLLDPSNYGLPSVAISPPPDN